MTQTSGSSTFPYRPPSCRSLFPGFRLVILLSFAVYFGGCTLIPFVFPTVFAPKKYGSADQPRPSRRSRDLLIQ